MKTSMGVNNDYTGWVKHRQDDGTVTVYRTELDQNVPRADYVASDYSVAVEDGPDVLDHDEVRTLAHIAFVDAFGAV